MPIVFHKKCPKCGNYTTNILEKKCQYCGYSFIKIPTIKKDDKGKLLELKVERQSDLVKNYKFPDIITEIKKAKEKSR